MSVWVTPLAGQALTRPFGSSWVGATASADHVTDGFGSWTGFGLRAAAAAGDHDLMLFETRWQEAFGDRGVYGSIANRHAFGRRWFTTVSVGGGTGRFYFPDLRLDASLHGKWGAAERLVSTIGVTYVRSKSIYRDVAVFGSFAAYFDAGVFELGGRANWSDPGTLGSGRGFAALTLGHFRSRALTLRGEAGTESYQLIGQPDPIRSFASQSAAAELEQWLSRGWSVRLGAEWYHNPFYQRTGGRLGLTRYW
ncbi:MAG: YaiO family outer membrane beta-barrel protein [Gemmatimonadota bacterium]